MASDSANASPVLRDPVGGDRSRDSTELLAGRIVAVTWLFWVVAFTIGQLVGAITISQVADVAVVATVALLAYVVLRWEHVSAWAIIAATLLWPVGFPILLSVTGGDNVGAATITTFVVFALPGLVAGVLILDGRRRQRTG